MSDQSNPSGRKRIVEGCETLFSTTPIIPYVYVLRYRPMVRREVELASLNQSDQILNIGCGSIPATAINLAGLTAGEIVCLDYDRDAVANARNVVSRYGLSNRITVCKGDGRTVKINGFDAVVVALHTIGKSTVLDNFLSSAEPEQKMILRYPRSHLREQYGQPDRTYQPDNIKSQIGVNLECSALFSGDKSY